MNSMIKKWTATTLALAMAVSMGVSVSAKPQSSKGLSSSTKTTTTAAAATKTTAPNATANDYGVNMSGNTVQLIKNGKVTNTYAAKSADIVVKISAAGNFVLTFTKADNSPISLTLGQQANVVFSGTYNSLTFDTNLPNTKTFQVSGTIGTLNVNAPVAVTVNADAAITALKAGNTASKVTVTAGAKVTSAAAANKASITGVATVGTMAAVTTAATTPAVSAPNAPGVITGQKTVKLEIDDVAQKKYIVNFVYLAGNVVEIIPKSGVTLGNVMKDLELTVKTADNMSNKVSGSWSWVGTTAAAKAVSGDYVYRFTPSQSGYNTFDLHVSISGIGGSKTTVSAPKISFYGEPRGKGGSVDIEVTLPAGISKGDTLVLHAGSWTQTKTLTASNSGDTVTYAVEIDDSSLSNNSRVKVYATLNSNGKSVNSNTISYTYKEDGDDLTLRKPSISLSSGHGDGEVTVYVTLPPSVGSGDEVVVSYSGTKSSGSRSVSENLSDSDAGETIKVDLYINGDDGDVAKVKATIKSGGRSATSDTKNYTLDFDD